jgi:hypothetical protein
LAFAFAFALAFAFAVRSPVRGVMRQRALLGCALAALAACSSPSSAGPADAAMAVDGGLPLGAACDPSAPPPCDPNISMCNSSTCDPSTRRCVIVFVCVVEGDPPPPPCMGAADASTD